MHSTRQVFIVYIGVYGAYNLLVTIGLQSDAALSELPFVLWQDPAPLPHRR